MKWGARVKMKRREFFRSIGFIAVASQIPRLELPPYIPTTQIIKSGEVRICKHVGFDYPENAIIGKFELGCPSCGYSGKFHMALYTDLDDLDYYSVIMNGKHHEVDCWKCKKVVHYMIHEKAKWRRT